jgi:uncharacterized membrane protein YhaH (DUF805 family)
LGVQEKEGRTMGFQEAISYCFRNYVGFRGRAARSEYWFWVLFVFLLQIVAWLIDMTVFGFNTTGVNPISVIVALATFLPGLAVSVRRLHDIDRVGWWVLLGLIPVIGWIVLIVWACMRGTVGTNRFGSDPLEGKV